MAVNKKIYGFYLRLFLSVVAPLFFVPANSQQQSIITQYFNNPLIINPAFAGTRNSLAIDLGIRQQWMGIDGAPQTYFALAHSPINRSKISVGGSLMTDMAGPVTHHHLSFAYSYLARINRRAFVSFGLNTGLNTYSVGLNNLNIVNDNDPLFGQNISNAIKPTFGSGLVVFTPSWYVSFSVPQIPLNKISIDANTDAFSILRHYYVSAGYYFLIAEPLSLKLTWMGRFVDNGISNNDITGMFTIVDIINVGASYRLNTAGAIMLGAQINKNLGILYSYDFPLAGTKFGNIGSQEITLSFDINKFFVRNRDREFLRRKKSEEDRTIKSIRYF